MCDYSFHISMNRIVHFEIFVSDMQRAIDFYTTVLGWEIKKWDSPDMEYWMVMTGKDEEGATYHGIDGGMLLRKGDAPSESAAHNAYVCTALVKNIDEILQKVEKAGGRIVTPKFALAGMAWQAYCIDTEGNKFGLHEPDKNAK